MEFRYAAPEFLRAEEVRLQYRLEGYDADWRDGGQRRQASYTNLSPGTYAFRYERGSEGCGANRRAFQLSGCPSLAVSTTDTAVARLFDLQTRTGGVQTVAPSAYALLPVWAYQLPRFILREP